MATSREVTISEDLDVVIVDQVETHALSQSNTPDILISPTGGFSNLYRSHSIDSTLDSFFSHEATHIIECHPGAGEYNTGAILHYCRNKILRPRDIIFSILGMRSWSKDGADVCLCIQAFNKLYFMFLLAFLCVGPVLEYNICFRRDHGIGDMVTNMDQHYNESLNHNDSTICKDSLVFAYIIPHSVFLIAYLVSCVVFRLGEAEHLQTLLERVYLLAICSPWELVKQRRLSCMWVVWLLLGISCILLSLGSMIMHYLAAQNITYSFIKPSEFYIEILLMCGAIGSMWLQDMIVVSALLLYCIQCHLLSTLLAIIRTTVLQGAASLLSTKKQIDESTRFLYHLNNQLAIGGGIFLCLVIFRAITAVRQVLKLIWEVQGYDVHGDTSLYDNSDLSKWLHFSGCVCNSLPWIIMMVLPLIMASRVTTGYRHLNKVGCQLNVRPYCYQSTPQVDIDSFLLYVSSLDLTAKILWIPIKTSFLVGVILACSMTIWIIGYL